MSELFNGDYNVFVYKNDLNRVVKHNMMCFDNAFYVFLNTTNNAVKIEKNGRLVARAATYTGV